MHALNCDVDDIREMIPDETGGIEHCLVLLLTMHTSCFYDRILRNLKRGIIPI